MKTALLTLSLISFLIFNGDHALYAQEASKEVAYMESLTGPLNNLRSDTWKYLRAVTRGRGARKIERARQNLIDKVKEAQKEIKSVRPLSTDEGYREAIKNYIDITYSVLKEDYDKILDMEDIAEQSYDQMEAYLLAREKADEKLKAAFDVVKEAENKFAADHNIQMLDHEDDELAKNIAKASQMLNYYNEVYLIFFKPYKQEAYVLDAQNRSDVSGMEQNINALKSITAESMEKLDAIESYNGDGSLKIAAKKILEFYKEEAEENFPKVVDFYIKQDNYEKVTNTVNAMSKKERTQKDIDRFNKAVDEYNQAVNDFNAGNEASNEKRTAQLEQWNKSVEDFFSKHGN